MNPSVSTQSLGATSTREGEECTGLPPPTLLALGSVARRSLALCERAHASAGGVTDRASVLAAAPPTQSQISLDVCACDVWRVRLPCGSVSPRSSRSSCSNSSRNSCTSISAWVPANLGSGSVNSKAVDVGTNTVPYIFLRVGSGPSLAIFVESFSQRTGTGLHTRTRLCSALGSTGLVWPDCLFG